jgi:hypothetical protein
MRDMFPSCAASGVVAGTSAAAAAVSAAVPVPCSKARRLMPDEGKTSSCVIGIPFFVYDSG